ncbi:aminodeoxychorismate/anthranilate synthase component II [Sphingosinicella sp. LHD-64]|uniref:anthranilate synthase component II n=1 Tax=Sphingosinicella sp. LHD-64 TaxID=3072139 RepID=UPI002810627D|nr:aminodeoxychorismate/anthranilate synthase component II [Sphingosinicella sp. LHD-64]MDQ8755577.1 aminodeoxychorismate/anthranilate synthase component II [Sphingosinicella sp. LHD-64]
MILMIDNRDSFTFNLVEAFERLGETVTVLRNSIGVDAALIRAEAENALIVLSPGPGRPEDAGCCLELIARAKGRAPVLGVCLGHQAIVHEAGGTVVGAHAIVHGKASVITHDGTGPFEGLPNPLRVGRYHSLCTPSPPARFRVHGEIDGMAMAISDPEARQYGVQFHPESILTPHGDHLLHNIVRLAVAP